MRDRGRRSKPAQRGGQGPRPSANSRLTIVVLGYVVRCPLGGVSWQYLQYALGFAALGHDVYFIEDSGDFPGCYDPSRDVTDADPSFGLSYARDTFARAGLGERWCYYDAHTEGWCGPCAGSIEAVCDRADLVVNVSGVNPLRPWLMKASVRVLVDTDPVFTQIRHLTDPAARAEAARHTLFASFGETFAAGGSTIPDDGFPWFSARQPVVLEHWPCVAPSMGGQYTTVMQWASYPAAEYDGRSYGMKSDAFPPFLSLPRRTPAKFNLALGGPPATPREMMRAHGWSLADPLAITRDPWTYRNFIQASRGEFGIAKHGYVASRSGWFSERSALYLASGRPVLAHDTGLPAALLGGEGVIPFSTPDDVLAGIDAIEAQYERHCRAAREIAESCFSADKVLGHLLEKAGASGARAGRPQAI